MTTMVTRTTIDAQSEDPLSRTIPLLTETCKTDVLNHVDGAEKSFREMKVNIKQEDFLHVLSMVMKVAQFNTMIPVVYMATCPRVLPDLPAHVLFTCRNQDVTISIECEAEVEYEGPCTIPVKPLLECVRTFSKGKHIIVEVQKTLVSVGCGKRVFKLHGGMNAEAFPLEQEMTVDDGAPCSLDADVFRQAIKEVHFAAADNAVRPVLSTVCMRFQEECLELAALDGYRMAVRTISLPITIRHRNVTLLVPVASLLLLAEVMPSACSVVFLWSRDRKHIVFQAGLVQVVSRLSEGIFPDYQSVIHTRYTTSFTVFRKDLDQIVKAFKQFAQDNANIFTLSYSRNLGRVGCLAVSNTVGEAYDEINVPIDGEDGCIMFNIRYLMDVLKYVQVDSYCFNVTTEHGPGFILVEGRNDYLYVLMPMSCKK